ncbi:MAG: hypothetical protein DMD35_10570 [Gemmatimonadetes bacterium]|nr:MAG: hypothetical protein DMD35_10570 [Gemmatimonadota bacterium]
MLSATAEGSLAPDSFGDVGASESRDASGLLQAARARRVPSAHARRSDGARSADMEFLSDSG